MKCTTHLSLLPTETNQWLKHISTKLTYCQCHDLDSMSKFSDGYCIILNYYCESHDLDTIQNPLMITAWCQIKLVIVKSMIWRPDKDR